MRENGRYVYSFYTLTTTFAHISNFLLKFRVLPTRPLIFPEYNPRVL